MTPKAPSLIDFKNPSIRTLHFTWLAFFLTFVVWFNMAGVLSEMIKQFDWLTKANVKALLVTNVALTIPARIIVGGLIDKYGPRRIFAGLMVIMVIPGLTFAFGDNLTQLVVSRLALGAIGAGFVIGIKMTANWFTPKYIGRAEGFYAGWGNFGSAAAAALVPFVAVNLLGGDWRWSLAITSIVAAIYGVIYFMIVNDYPEGQEPSADKKKGGPMPVSSYLDLGQYLLWELPLYGALGLVAFVLHKQMIHGEHMISMNIVIGIWIALFIVYLADVMRILKTNLPRLKAGVPDAEKFPFGSVGALNSTYFANFGAELAIVSMLPMFFYEVFSELLYADGSQVMTLTLAGAVAGSFAFMNLVARPLGGLLSDKMGSRKKTMLLYMSGITIGFFLMAMISKYGPMGADGEVSLLPQFNSMGWLIVSVVITMFASFFVQGAEGATFAMIPSIKKEMTGRIAGMAGAFGNVGAVTYLFLYTFMDDKTFLYMLSGGAFISLVYCFFMLKEPKDAFADSF
ncbi:MAG: MFS transporter [Bacteroidetes bacterium]|nr:MFS transporter [Bacteroidota bacterium]